MVWFVCVWFGVFSMIVNLLFVMCVSCLFGVMSVFSCCVVLCSSVLFVL